MAVGSVKHFLACPSDTPALTNTFTQQRDADPESVTALAAISPALGQAPAPQCQAGWPGGHRVSPEAATLGTPTAQLSANSALYSTNLSFRHR